jgi:hypothetical protein
MRLLTPKTLLAGATALLFVVACGGNAGQSPDPVATLAPGQTTGTGGETTPAPGASAQPTASPPAWTQLGAIALAIGPSAIVPLEGTCTITPPPEDPEAPPLPDPGPGDLPFIAGSTFTVSLADPTSGTDVATPAPEATPGAAASPSAEASPGVSPEANGNNVEVTVLLSTLSDPNVPPIPVVEESPDPNATAPPSTDALLPFSIDPTTATATATFPNQFIFEPTIAGGAVARDAHSGYFALDPGTGELVLVHFLCNELLVAQPEAPPAPEATPAASPPASPEGTAAPETTAPETVAPESPGASPEPSPAT